MTQTSDDEKILKYFEKKFCFVLFQTVFSIVKFLFRTVSSEVKSCFVSNHLSKSKISFRFILNTPTTVHS